jgi:hypothetical protein
MEATLVGIVVCECFIDVDAQVYFGVLLRSVRG